jgi:hypothetical protein
MKDFFEERGLWKGGRLRLELRRAALLRSAPEAGLSFEGPLHFRGAKMERVTGIEPV